METTSSQEEAQPLLERKQETGNRKQETGNRKQETGNRKQQPSLNKIPLTQNNVYKNICSEKALR